MNRQLARALDVLLDPTIVFSFDRTGYQRHAASFEPSDLDVDLRGRICLITGSNSGVGRAAALALAKLGAHVRLLCRSEARGLEARDQIRTESGNSEVHLDAVDVSSLASIHALCERLPVNRVDVLVHNAGLMVPERRLSPDGLEVTFATHVLGPFLLTQLLRPRLERSQDARVITVTSGGMYSARLDLRDLAGSERPWDGVRAYAQTKRMQVVLSEEMARRWGSEALHFEAMHPGWADTNAVREALPRFWRLTRGILRSPAQGADTIVWLAAVAALPPGNGRLWFDRAPRRTHLLPSTRETDRDRQELWRVVEEAASGTRGAPGARSTGEDGLS
jgi:NAD(P)-dependent dehydrogenase (short-subunit alcohol dehydrogenase family)